MDLNQVWLIETSKAERKDFHRCVYKTEKTKENVCSVLEGQLKVHSVSEHFINTPVLDLFFLQLSKPNPLDLFVSSFSSRILFVLQASVASDIFTVSPLNTFIPVYSLYLYNI